MGTATSCLFQFTLAGLALAVGGAATAAPGDLLPTFAPEIRALAVPASVVALPDGRVLVGDGFSSVDGVEVSDRLLLGPDGGVAAEPVPGWLDGSALARQVVSGGELILNIRGGKYDNWFPLANGSWLVPAGDGGWQHAATGANAFPDLLPDEWIRPQFERDGQLWVVRKVAEGDTVLEARDVASGSVQTSLASGGTWPELPLAAVPAPDGAFWVLGGSGLRWSLNGYFQRKVFRVSAAGTWDETIPVLHVLDREARLSVGADGGYRVALDPHFSRIFYWPAPSSNNHRIHWISPTGAISRTVDLTVPLGMGLPWTEDSTGRLLAPGTDGNLSRFQTDGSVDDSFTSPGWVSSLRPLPNGKWLVDGRQRLLADGEPDPAWTTPRLEKTPTIRSLHRFPDGRVLAAGDFTTVAGEARTGLAVFLTDGALDAGFVPDPRLKRLEQITISGGRVFVVMEHPIAWGATQSRIAKLLANGSLDEAFLPPVNQLSDYYPYPGGSLTAYPHVDGGVLVSRRSSGEVQTLTLFRLHANGTMDTGFTAPTRYNLLPPGVVLSDGRFVISNQIYAADGRLLRAVGGSLSLRPLCEWQGGVLFQEDFNGVGATQRSRLRLWRGDAWTPLLIPPVDGSVQAAIAGGDGSLYLQWRTPEGASVLRRYDWTGRPDAAFQAPTAAQRPRRQALAWRVSTSTGFESYDPAAHDLEVAPTALLWTPEGKRLWVSGFFNRLAEENRDGLAWLDGSGASVSGFRASAFTAWEAGFGLPAGSAREDADGDGVPNGIEFVLGTDPWTKSDPITVTIDASGQILVRYPLSAEAVPAPVLEISTDLETWTSAKLFIGATNTTTTDGPGDAREVTTTIAPRPKAQRFIRLRQQL